MGIYYFLQKKYRKAIEQIKISLSHNSVTEYAKAVFYTTLALAHIELGESDKAMSILKASEKILLNHVDQKTSLYRPIILNYGDQIKAMQQLGNFEELDFYLMLEMN